MFKKISVSTNKIHEDDSLGVLNHSTKLNPMCGKKTTHVKKLFDLLLLYLYNRFFLVLEVLYERSCSMKGEFVLIGSVLKHCKVPKYYDHDCSYT